jgi:hypothetical protein
LKQVIQAMVKGGHLDQKRATLKNNISIIRANK